MIDKFWLENADLYSQEGFEINEMGTHPHLIRYFNKYCSDSKTVLDFGCGDGSLILKLNKDIEVSLFDISKPMLNIARRKLSDSRPIIYSDKNLLPNNYFDCIFISMVFICVPIKSEIEAIIEQVAKAKKENGIVIVANPHPCFRDKPYSSYYTEYSIGKRFSYFNEGEKHEVNLRNGGIKFNDFNWSITYLLNSFLQRGLKLQEIFEVEDNKTNEFYNERFSPSIIYIFK
jgi:ubiquinone/menaquinone biosynthesis C-methylase UbiE